MITNNDLFDIYYVFVLIRNDIKYDLNAQIVKNVAEAILERCDEHNRIRKAISSIVATGVSDLVFGTGYNSIAAAVYKSVTDTPNSSSRYARVRQTRGLG